jgi:hypothetical protein
LPLNSGNDIATAGTEPLRGAAPIMLIGFGTGADEMLQSVRRSYVSAFRASRPIDMSKLALAREYDVAGMNPGATICHWGRSGTLLLSRYLDDHPQIVMLPYRASESIYNYFQEYESLSVWEKLIAYPTYSH